MDRLSLPDRASEPQPEDLERRGGEGRGVRGGARNQAIGPERRREGTGGLAEVGHVEGAPHVAPRGMARRMVANGEQDLRIRLPRPGPRPDGRGLRVEQNRRVPEGPRVGLLSRRPDFPERPRRARAPPRVVKPCRPQGRLTALFAPPCSHAPDRLRHRLDVGQATRTQSRRDPGPYLVGPQSVPWRTYGCTIEPPGTVVWAIRFHPLSSTPRPTCESAMRVNGPMTDSRPTLEIPSMMTPG